MQPFRKQAPPDKLERAEFHEQFERSFRDPRFDPMRDAVKALEERAWRDYCARQQHPTTRN